MTIVRAPRPDAHFLVVRNETARDARLSYRARGLLIAILSRPDDWRSTSAELAREGTEGREAIRTALRELEALGYIERRKTQHPDTKRWVHEQIVYDTPTHETAGQASAQEPDDGKPGPGNPDDGKPGVGNLGANQRTETNNRDKEPTTSREENPEARRLAELLADLIVDNGLDRPKVSDAWVLCIDRMMRLDHRTPEQIENAMRWAQGDDFWFKNVLSPKKLREQWERLRAEAIAKNRNGTPKPNGQAAGLAVIAKIRSGEIAS